jgi:repressor LexA
LGLQPASIRLTLKETPSAYFPKKQDAPPPVTETLSFTTTRRLRVLGLVAAGSPEQSAEEDSETREATLPPRGADYLVRVTGDSMVDAGLQEHDLLFVKTTETPRSGDIVVAQIAASGEVVKRFHREPAADGGTANIWLVSENGQENYPPIAVDVDTRIRGVVTGLLRDF